MDFSDVNNKNLGVIGCGKMASAILEGAVKNNFIKPDKVFLFDVNFDNSSSLSQKFGFQITNSISELLNTVDIVLIATKPFVVNDVLCEIKDSYNNQLVMSILAGVKIQKYLSAVSNLKLIRIMPNTPALVNKGMSAICASSNTNSDEVNFAYNFMKNCGEVIITTEDKIDIITALSGSGPAYFYKFIECMANSAHKMGLDYKEALLLSAQTALGSAEMVLKNNFDIPQLIKNVTTPGGCTEVGNQVLNNSDLSQIIDKTISDTAYKASELGKS